MPYVKAQVPKEVQRAINMEANKYGVTVSDIAGQELQKWYNQSNYEIEIEDNE